MTRPLRAGFTGYYGVNNFGDDLFGMVCAAAAREFWAAEPQLVGPAIDGVDVRATMPRWYPASLYGSTSPFGKASRYCSFRRGLAASDVLVLGGGSVINARESFRKPLMLRAKRGRGLRLAAVGVSIGPFADTASELASAAFIERFDYISVRDRRSHALAEKMGFADKVHAGRDLAGLLPPPQRRHMRSGDPLVVGVAPCRYTVKDYSAPTVEAWQAGLVEALAALAASCAIRVQVFSLNEHAVHGDRALADGLCERLCERSVHAKRIGYRLGPAATVDAIAACDAIVSARLHGAIVAYMQGVPFAIVDYHPKCRDFAEDIGLPAERLIGTGNHGPDDLATALASLLESERQPAVSRDVYAAQARAGFQCAPWSTSQPA